MDRAILPVPQDLPGILRSHPEHRITRHRRRHPAERDAARREPAFRHPGEHLGTRELPELRRRLTRRGHGQKALGRADAARREARL